MLKSKWIALSLAGMMMTGTSAVLAADSGFYIGGSIGQSKLKNLDSTDIDTEFASLGVTSSTTVDDTDTGFKIFGGYRIMQYLAVEVAYADLGEATANSAITAPSLGQVVTKANADAFTISALGILPIGENFSVFGRVGVNFWNADLKTSGFGVSASDDADGTDWVYGAGVMYNVNANFALRGEWERYDLDGTDVDLLSAGISWSF